MNFRFIPVVIIITTAALLFGKALFPPLGYTIYGWDIYDNYYFRLHYLRESIRKGEIPFWNPYNFSGTPFLSHPNINIFYPPKWLFIIFPFELSFSWYFYLHIIWAGMTMYWLVRQFSGSSGALIAALVYTLGGYFAARVYSGHLEYVDVASWVPLVFGLFRRALILSSTRNIIFAGLSLSMVLLCGNELFFLFSLEIIFLYIVFLLFQKFDKNTIISNIFCYVKVVGFSTLIGLGTAAVDLLSRYQFMTLSIRSGGIPYSVAGAGSLPFEGLLLFLKPFIWGMPFRENYTYKGPWPNLMEYFYYIGFLPTFAIVVILVIWLITKTRLIKIKIKVNLPSEFWFFLFFVLPLFLLISFGTNISPNFHQLLWQFSFVYKGIRFPARHLFVVFFSLSILSGIAIEKIKSFRIHYLLISIIIADLFITNKKFYQVKEIPQTTFDQNLINLLKKDDSLSRILPDFAVISKVRRDLEFGATSMFGLQSTSDYNSMILQRYYHFIDLLNRSAYSSLSYYNVEIPPPNPLSLYIDFLNVKYILVDKETNLIDQVGDRFRLILDKERYKLFENLTYKPRFTLLGQAQIFDSEKELEEILKSQTVDLSKSVLFWKKDALSILNTNLSCQEKLRGEITIQKYNSNQIILDINSFCDSILSSSEVYYPSWRAKIDGKQTRVLRSNYAFRSLYIPKGRHVVEFYYDPYLYYLGGLITVITIISVLIIIKRNAN